MGKRISSIKTKDLIKHSLELNKKINELLMQERFRIEGGYGSPKFQMVHLG